MIRAGLRAAGIGAVTLALIPMQWASLRLGLGLRRTVPMVYHRIVLRILGVRIVLHGEPDRRRPLLLVSNHCSWLDITVLGSLFPLFFVAKHEIASWPLFGLLARLQRSVFVDRSRRHKTGEVNAEIASRLSEGDPVVLFGEGTSSDGNRVLPFRSALIGAAHDVLEEGGQGHVLMQPVSLGYSRLDGLPMGRFGRPHVAWYGDMDMFTHLWKVLRRPHIDVDVGFGEPLPFDGTFHRKEAARTLEEAVRRMTAAAVSGRA